MPPQKTVEAPGHAERGRDAGGVQPGHDEALQAEPTQHRTCRNKGRDDQGVDRDPRRAGHQRRNQDRRKPASAARDDPCRHDARDGAGEARQQRDEGAAVQPGAAHDPVHQEGGPGHVAEIFEQQDEQEQRQDLRQEDEDAADPGDDPVTDKAQQPSLGKDGSGPHGQPVEGALNQLHRRLRPGEHRLEHQEQHCKEDDETEHGMQHDAIKPPGEEVGPPRDPDRRVEDTVGLALRRAQLRRIGLGPIGCPR